MIITTFILLVIVIDTISWVFIIIYCLLSIVYSCLNLLVRDYLNHKYNVTTILKHEEQSNKDNSKRLLTEDLWKYS